MYLLSGPTIFFRKFFIPVDKQDQNDILSMKSSMLLNFIDHFLSDFILHTFAIWYHCYGALQRCIGNNYRWSCWNFRKVS